MKALRSHFQKLVLVFCVGSLDAADVDCDHDTQSTSPQGVHLAYAGSAGHSISISFFTCGTGGTPYVQLLDEPSRPSQTFNGTTSRYYMRQHHDIVASGLEPGLRYRYIVGLVGGSKRGPFTFHTASVDETFTAVVIGDMGVNNSEATISRLTERASSYNVTIHLGDVGYADDYAVPLHIEKSSGRSYEAVYDLFQRSVEPIASVAPYMVMPGNHDLSCCATGDWGCPKEQRNFSAFRYRFRMPSAESGAHPSSHFNMWYSFQVGSVHFVSVSSETDFPNAPTTPHTRLGGGAGGGFGDQLAWLRRDLSAAQSNPSVKFIVAMGHRPWYSSMPLDWPPLAPRHVQHAFEPLLYEFGVDMWLCGHKHFYERAKAAYAGKVDEARGIVQIVNGAAGNNEGVERGFGGGLIVASNYATTGYGELSVLNATSLRWRYLLSSDGSVSDELILHARDRRLWRDTASSAYV